MLKLWVTIILILAAMQAIGLGIDNQGLAGNLSFKGGNISLAYPNINTFNYKFNSAVIPIPIKMMTLKFDSESGPDCKAAENLSRLG